MAEAARIQGLPERNHIAVIGDGALTGGMAFEALNNAGVSDANMLLVLNDNRISIDAGVGAMKEYLRRATDFKLDHRIKTYRFQESNLFESLHFNYSGPVDGHDIPQLTKSLQHLKNIKGPKILHIITTKGKGYKPAEKHQTKYHSVASHEARQEEAKAWQNKGAKYQDVFGQSLLELAENNPKIVGITPAMPTGSSLHYLMDKFPERAFDVGIAEQHAVTFAAGLASQGLKAYCVIYSTFLQRAYDQVIHDVCLQNLPVVFCLDRAGLVGEDGATHQGVFDIASLKAIPNLILASPINEAELRHMLYTAQFCDRPIAIRYPRGRGVLENWKEQFKKLDIGKSQLLSQGEKLLVLSYGPVGNHVIRAEKELRKESISFSHVNMRFVKPFDSEMLTEQCQKHEYILCIEDGVVSGGFGSSVLEFVEKHQFNNRVRCLGVADEFIEQASVFEQQQQCGIDPDSILKHIRSYFD
jgi:1-deoxy-D-xylulose-5-phosphate synthase